MVTTRVGHGLGRAAALVVALFVLAPTPAFGGPAAASAAPPVWKIVASPNPAGNQGSGLGAVSCTAVDHCMAVGSWVYADDGEGEQSHTLAESWNGSRWTIVPSPNQPGATNDQLLGVKCISSSDCLAVGLSG